MVMLSLSKFCSIVSEVFALERLKPKGNFEFLAFKSGRGRLQEYPNMAILLENVWYFGKLVVEEKWVACEW